MKFRVARHTSNLTAIVFFYVDMLGLQVLGNFDNHNGYNGVFLGLKGNDWHLEFTVSADAPNHHADADDLLVWYAENDIQYQQINERFTQNQVAELEPKNPYWKVYGCTYADPDNYRIVIAKPVS